MQSITSEPNKNTTKDLQRLTTTTLATPKPHNTNLITPSTGSTIDESDTEEVVVEGVSAIPLNIPGSFTTLLPTSNIPPNLDQTNLKVPNVASAKSGSDLSGASSDSADSEGRRSKKKSIPYYESVGRSYKVLAEEKGWKNPDNTIFPISVTNLCNYVRVKKDTNNSKSVDWYIAALKKYQETVLNIKDWDEVRRHPEVKTLMNQIKDEGNSKIGNSSPGTPNSKDKGKGNIGQSISEINKDNSGFPQLNDPQLGFLKSLQTFSNQSPGPAETALALLGSEYNPLMVDDDSFSKRDPKKLVDLEGYEFNYEQKFNSRMEALDPMIISASDDDEDYVPPKKSSSARGYIPDRKRRRKRYLDSESHSDDDEPESFKSRYETSLTILKSKYTDACKHHPNGCFTAENGKHFVLNDKLLRRWASLCASGDDVNEESLPHSEELERDFSELKAIPI